MEDWNADRSLSIAPATFFFPVASLLLPFLDLDLGHLKKHKKQPRPPSSATPTSASSRQATCSPR